LNDFFGKRPFSEVETFETAADPSNHRVCIKQEREKSMESEQRRSEPREVTRSDPGRRIVWLFSPVADLAAFTGSFALAWLVILGCGVAGSLDDPSPPWVWITAILLVDVGHVWSTLFRIEWSGPEFQRRWPLYLTVPAIGYVLGVAAAAEGELFFWRCLAYVAVFHFVRQQFGWVMRYRAKAGETDPMTRRFDSAVIYLATIYPLVWWHTKLPREIAWFLDGDFLAAPAVLEVILRPLWGSALIAYGLRALWLWIAIGPERLGKDLVVGTTALSWYGGIVLLDSDIAFTLTNTLTHGIPYLVAVYWYGWVRRESRSLEPPVTSSGARAGACGWFHLTTAVRFLAICWLLAFVEELLWHRHTLHRRAWLFGQGADAGPWRMWLVPLLALPQWCHYILDGFLWRRPRRPAGPAG
jgi:hypothetical protein